jgi:hypothetical protein
MNFTLRERCGGYAVVALRPRDEFWAAVLS